jgi:peptide/nickel transport system permease protein
MRVPLLLLVVTLVVVAFAPILATHDPLKTNPSLQFQPPGSVYLLGTDSLGRDVFSRTLYGGRSTLFTSILASLIALIPGVVLGLLAGAGRWWLDLTINMLTSAILAVPGLIVALVVLTLLGRGLMPLSIAIGLSQIAPCIAVTRAAVQGVRSLTYIEAAHGLGATHRRILFNHILTNVQPTILAYAAIIFSYSILNIAALSFLGLGGEPGTPDWGVMLAEGRAALRIAPWIGIAPGLAITATVWAANALADQVAKR